MNGFLCVLKPTGMTSSDVGVRVRRKLGRGVKVGHAGTLDPEASGVLPLMIGRAARLFDYLVEKEKTYVAQLKPGYATDTQDAHGAIIAGEGAHATRAQKLCDLARQGIDVKVEPRPTQVYAIQVLHENADGSFMLQIRCGRGTYIRTLCHDIGEALGTKAHMGMLLRAQTGMFTLDDAHTIEEIDAADELSPLLTAMDQPLGHLPRLDVQPKAERFVRNGNRLTRRELIGDVQPGQPTRLYLNGQFCGIGRFDGETLKFDAMLLE